MFKELAGWILGMTIRVNNYWRNSWLAVDQALQLNIEKDETFSDVIIQVKVSFRPIVPLSILFHKNFSFPSKSYYMLNFPRSVVINTATQGFGVYVAQGTHTEYNDAKALLQTVLRRLLLFPQHSREHIFGLFNQNIWSGNVPPWFHPPIVRLNNNKVTLSSTHVGKGFTKCLPSLHMLSLPFECSVYASSVCHSSYEVFPHF